MKKVLAIILAATLIFSLAGCSKNNEVTDTSGTGGEKAKETITASDNDKEEAKEVTESADKSGEKAETAPEKQELQENQNVRFTEEQIKAMTALEVTYAMGNGINLGNTMEAYGRAQFGTTGTVTDYETFWGQPVTTPEIINSMKQAGFDALRIPIAWTNMIAFETGDYTIGTAYMNRIKEIVGYALDADMFVIINDHWDGSWWGMFGSATEETRENAMKLYISMWSQIAEEFKDYSYRLIFEGANEEVGNRLNDTDIAKDSGTLSMDDCYKQALVINQTFVDTVRKSGGKNADRFLLIPGYDTDVAKTCDDRFVMPKDTANNKLLLSMHYYTPWGYCGNSSLATWGTVKNYNEMNELLAMPTKYTEQGYGIIIGEYAVALADDGSVKENTCDFMRNFLYNCDKYGYCPMLWDCSNVFIRTELGFKDDELAEVYLTRSYQAQSSMTQSEEMAAATARIEEKLAEVTEAEKAAGEAAGLADDKALAWIMYNSGDWGIMYSVGDTYDPLSKTEGLIVKEAEITGEGTYTVGFDFTKTSAGKANGTAFCALAIGNGETLFPGYIIKINKILVNGKALPMKGRAYTTSDDGKCTRVNIYNQWVTTPPEDIRLFGGGKTGASASIIDPELLVDVETFEIEFEYVKGN